MFLHITHVFSAPTIGDVIKCVRVLRMLHKEVSREQKEETKQEHPMDVPRESTPLTNNPHQQPHSTPADTYILIGKSISLYIFVGWVASVAYFSWLGHMILDGVRINEVIAKHPPALLREIHHPGSSFDSVSTQSGQLGEANILVVYLDDHEHQHVMAQEIAKGAQSISQQLSVRVGTVSTLDFSDILQSDAIIIGSPVYNANIHPDVQRWINAWDFTQDLSRKVGAAFATGGGMSAGEEGTMINILRSMLVFRMICVGGDSWQSGFGASAVVGEDPFGRSRQDEPLFPQQCYQDDDLIHPMFLKKARDLGARVADIATALKV